MRAEVVAAPGDHAIAALATRQHGVVSRAQLRELGLSDAAIGRRATAGRLHRLHRGVYAVGHRVVGAHGRWMAGVLACGPGAALSHTSAAALWELRPSAAARIDVTVPTAGGRGHATLRIHRSSSLTADAVTTHHGIGVTTPARTLLDLSAALPRRGLERALDQAEVLRLLDVSAIEALVSGNPGHRGIARLRDVLSAHEPGTTITKSDLEELVLALCERHGLPRPRTNTFVAGLEVDALFAQHRVAVEADSWRHHRTRRAFERDRERDAILTRAGHRVLRFTHAQMTHDAATVAETIAAALRGYP